MAASGDRPEMLVAGVYARYSTRFQDSIVDQVRKLLEEAHRRGFAVPRDQIFYDIATRGFKQNRRGLNQVKAALANRSIEVLLVFSTNRLGRKMHQAGRFVEEEIVERGLRCVFINQGVDTAQPNWKMMLGIHAAVDENVAQSYSDNVRAAHEGLFLQGLVSGSLPLGYGGEDVPGTTNRKGRPRQRIVVDQGASAWVLRIFRWYADDRISIDEIARMLNADETAPLPKRAVAGEWTHSLVRATLTNRRYVGDWAYGRTESRWLSSKDYARQFLRDEPRQVKAFPNLQIVPQALWLAAQQRLEAERRNGGRKPRTETSKPRANFLSGLLWCPTHNRPLVVGGYMAGYFVCPSCRRMPAAERPLFSMLNRELAARVVCEKLANLLRSDPDLSAQIAASCQRQVIELQQPDSTVTAALEREFAQVRQAIQFTMQNVGTSSDDQAEATSALRALRRRRDELQSRMRAAQLALANPVRTPSKEELVALMDRLGETLLNASTSTDPRECGKARYVIEQLTGGRIAIRQAGARLAKHGWLEGQFSLDLRGVVEAEFGLPGGPLDSTITTATVEFRDDLGEGVLADRVADLLASGLLYKEVAQKLDLWPSQVTNLARLAAAHRGTVSTDGRRRRSTLERKQASQPEYQRLAEAAWEGWEAGESISEIARGLNCSTTTVERAVALAARNRGLSAPSIRDRRARLRQRAIELYQQQVPMQEVARQLGRSEHWVRDQVRCWCAASGVEYTDGRARRHRSMPARPIVTPSDSPESAA